MVNYVLHNENAIFLRKLYYEIIFKMHKPSNREPFNTKS